jgi:hypothetical protein
MLSMTSLSLPTRKRTLALLLMTALAASPLLGQVPACAQKYESRLNKLLIRKSDLYLPTRLVLGEAGRFVVKAQPGSQVKVFISPKASGYVLPNGVPLRVGEEVQELSGTVPETGVLELMIEMPNQEGLDGKVIYVDAVAGPSDEALAPIDLVDSTGRRTDTNTLVITKPAEKGGPMIMPSMPGFDPQMFNRLTTMGDIYTSQDERKKQLLDEGNVDPNRQMDQNPFINRGIQPGIR